MKPTRLIGYMILWSGIQRWTRYVMFESKKIIVEFVIHLMQRLYSKAPKTSPQQAENGDSRKKAGIT